MLGKGIRTFDIAFLVLLCEYEFDLSDMQEDVLSRQLLQLSRLIQDASAQPKNQNDINQTKLSRNINLAHSEPSVSRATKLETNVWKAYLYTLRFSIRLFLKVHLY